MAIEIPDKTYFKIGEAAKLVGVKPYIIRYWESEFRALRPAKTKSRQRLFRRKDIELLLLIKQLLYDQKFTIEGARLQLKELTRSGLGYGEILDGIEVGGLGALAQQVSADAVAADAPDTAADPPPAAAPAGTTAPAEHPEHRATALALKDAEQRITSLTAELAAAKEAQAQAEARVAATQNTLVSLQSRMRTMWLDLRDQVRER